MAKKIRVKLILELRESKISQTKICSTRHISHHSVSSVYKIADERNITYQDVKDMSDDEVYNLFYPDKYVIQNLYKDPNYEYIHTELKKTGVNLKLLWREYKDSCEAGNEFAMGYTKFCDGY